jgi:hypothetical protein
MQTTGAKLKEFYGLLNGPDGESIIDWAKKTKKYISSGLEPYSAGKLSAILLFPDYGSTTQHRGFSVSDLLDEIET